MFYNGFLGIPMYLIGFLQYLLIWVFAIWIYFDAKAWRRRGVPVSPGRSAGLFLFGYYITFIILLFSGISGRLDYMIGTGIEYLQFVFMIGYVIRRSTHHARIAKMENPPLPPTPAGHKWFFIFIFILPLILVLMLYLFVTTLFHGGLF